MQRPQHASQAIEVSAEGLHVGTYGPLQLYSAYQPILRITGDELSIDGWEGLIRPQLDDEPFPPALMFAEVDAADRAFVECICRTLHVRNYRNATPLDRDLHLGIHPASYESLDAMERELDLMFATLGDYRVPPQRIVCEIVEDDALETAVLASICTMLRAHGVRIAIDDFGTGSFGPQRYRRLRPEVVKIDGTMFRTLVLERSGRRLLAAMARTFAEDRTTLLVKGVETLAQLGAAADVGANLVQGYGLSRPLLLPCHYEAAMALKSEPDPELAEAG